MWSQKIPQLKLDHLMVIIHTSDGGKLPTVDMQVKIMSQMF
jgi:hypothetical protein